MTQWVPLLIFHNCIYTDYFTSSHSTFFFLHVSKWLNSFTYSLITYYHLLHNFAYTLSLATLNVNSLLSSICSTWPPPPLLKFCLYPNHPTVLHIHWSPFSFTPQFLLNALTDSLWILTHFHPQQFFVFAFTSIILHFHFFTNHFLSLTLQYFFLCTTDSL